MSQHSTIGGVTVFRSPPYGHRVFGNTCVFERAEVRIVGSAYRAVLCTWRTQADGDARLVAEYALPREYPNLGPALAELGRQVEAHLLAVAEDRVKALQVTRRAMWVTVLGDTDPP